MRATHRLMMRGPSPAPGSDRTFRGPAFLRAAEGREPAQRAGEPRVEHVLVLPQLARMAFRAFLRILHGPIASPQPQYTRGSGGPTRSAARCTSPGCFHPVEVNLRPAIRVEAHVPALHRRDSRRRQVLHPHEPLIGEVWLHDRIASVAAADGGRVVLLLDEEALLAERRHHFSRASNRSRPRNGPAFSFITARSIATTALRLLRRAHSKSF